MKKKVSPELALITLFAISLIPVFLFLTWENTVVYPPYYYLLSVPNTYPQRVWTVPEPDIKARSFLLAFVDNKGKTTVLFEQNSKVSYPIASLSKLFSVAVIKKLGVPPYIVIDPKTVDLDTKPKYKGKEIISGSQAIISALLESSNTAMQNLANSVDRKTFKKGIERLKKELELSQTILYTPTGLPYENKENRSSARDLLKLVVYLLQNSENIPELKITSREKYPILDINGKLSHTAYNTNLWFKRKEEDITKYIIWQKTGWTKEARGCQITVFQHPKNPDYKLITIVLGTEDRENESRKLFEWGVKAFRW